MYAYFKTLLDTYCYSQLFTRVVDLAYPPPWLGAGALNCTIPK